MSYHLGECKISRSHRLVNTAVWFSVRGKTRLMYGHLLFLVLVRLVLLLILLV